MRRSRKGLGEPEKPFLQQCTQPMKEATVVFPEHNLKCRCDAAAQEAWTI